MTALAAPRPTISLETGENIWRTFPVAADQIIYPGAIVATNASGNLVPASASTSIKCQGIAVPKRQQMKSLTGYVDTTGLAAAAVKCEVQSCIALVVNDGSSITKADIGNTCYLVDDQTVARTNGGTSQVTRGDVVFNGTDLVGVNVDGYTVSVNSITDDDTTLAALVAKWNADPVAKALAAATGDTAGAESWLYLTFIDSASHTVVAYSPATADVVTITNTVANVAATLSAAGNIHDVDSRGVWVGLGLSP